MFGMMIAMTMMLIRMIEMRMFVKMMDRGHSNCFQENFQTTNTIRPMMLKQNMTVLNMTRVTRVIMITLINKCQLHGMVDVDEGGGVGIDEDAGPHQVRGKVKAAKEKPNHKISRTDWLPIIHRCYTLDA